MECGDRNQQEAPTAKAGVPTTTEAATAHRVLPEVSTIVEDEGRDTSRDHAAVAKNRGEDGDSDSEQSPAKIPVDAATRRRSQTDFLLAKADEVLAASPVSLLSDDARADIERTLSMDPEQQPLRRRSGARHHRSSINRRKLSIALNSPSALDTFVWKHGPGHLH